MFNKEEMKERPENITVRSQASRLCPQHLQPFLVYRLISSVSEQRSQPAVLGAIFWMWVVGFVAMAFKVL